MRFRKKKLCAIFALIFTLALIVLAGAAIQSPSPARAAEEGDTLFLPALAELYLPLENPVGMAENGSYLVIADGDGLYIFDRAKNSYERYAHGEGKSISEVRFAPDGRLFFSDRDAHLYEYDFSSKSAVIQNNVTCSAFVIEGEMLYMAVVTSAGTTFYALPLTRGAVSMAGAKPLGEPIASTSGPRMFVLGGVVYCAVNNYVHAYTYQKLDDVYTYESHLLAGNTPVSELSSVCVFEEELYFTVNGSYSGDGVYRTRLDEGCEKLVSGKGYAAISAYDGRLYAVGNGAVRELKKLDDGSLTFTDYEISAASASSKRLSGAEDTVRARDLLVICDNGNERLLEYDLKAQTFSSLPCGAVEKVATDGEVIAVSRGTEIMLYPRGESKPSLRWNASSPVTGLAVTDGKCYYTCGTYTALAGGEETLRKVSFAGLTADLYGNLYAVDSTGAVTRFRESEFLNRAESGVALELPPLPSGFSSLRTDLDGNLYYLFEGALYQNGAKLSALSDEGLLYHKEGSSCTPRSFALGFEDDALFVQYGDHMIKTSLPQISNLSALSLNGVSDALHAFPAPDALKFFDAPTRCAGIEVDFPSGEEEKLSAVQYFRTQGGRGVLIAQAGKYSLLALYEEHSYRTVLFLSEDLKEAEASLQEAAGVRYLSSEVGIYRYPCLTDSLQLARLPRGKKLTLLWEVDAGEGSFPFGYAELSDGVRGYVPLGYLSEYVPAPEDPEGYTLGYLKANGDGVTFRADSGETVTVKERIQVRVYDSGDGRCFVRFERDGVTYTGQVTRSMIESGNPNALRMSIIIFLCVLAVGILAAYVILVPKKKRS